MEAKKWEDKEGFGTLFWQEEKKRKSEYSPHFTGYIVLKNDYKAGERVNIGAWEKETKFGSKMFTLREDDWQKRKDDQYSAGLERKRVKEDKEVKPNYGRAKPPADWDNEVPF